MLTIYGADLSSPANKVRFVANALQCPYEYRVIKLREGEHKQPWYLAINPVGKIPAISDGDFSLFESGAIIRYLCDKNNSPLYPKDLKQRAIVDQWTDFSNFHIMINVSKIVFNRVFAQRFNMPVSQDSLQDGLKFLDQNLPVIENRLNQCRFLAGDSMTIADITLLAALDPAEVAQIDLSKWPKTVALRNYLKSQAFYTQCFKNYGEGLETPVAKA